MQGGNKARHVRRSVLFNLHTLNKDYNLLPMHVALPRFQKHEYPFESLLRSLWAKTTFTVPNPLVTTTFILNVRQIRQSDILIELPRSR